MKILLIIISIFLYSCKCRDNGKGVDAFTAIDPINKKRFFKIESNDCISTIAVSEILKIGIEGEIIDSQVVWAVIPKLRPEKCFKITQKKIYYGETFKKYVQKPIDIHYYPVTWKKPKPLVKGKRYYFTVTTWVGRYHGYSGKIEFIH